MAKERYKDESLDIADAGAKVKALINDHLVELGINPKIPPVELLSDEFISQVNQHAKGSPGAKASEMEHAIRKHCTVKTEEDPAFYSKLSEKLEMLLEKHRDNWNALAGNLEKLREEAAKGRTKTVEGLSREASTFYEFIAKLTHGKGQKISVLDNQALKKISAAIVDRLKDTIGVLDFWNKPIEVKKLRGELEIEILSTNLPSLVANSQRIAVEILKLAEKRNDSLTTENSRAGSHQ